MTAKMKVCPHHKEKYEHRIIGDELIQNQKPCKGFESHSFLSCCRFYRPNIGGHCDRWKKEIT